jgi:hypothetical protein
MPAAPEDGFDWLTDDPPAEADIVVPERPKLKTAKDFLKHKIEVRRNTQNSPDYERGYRDGYFDCEQAERKKWYDKGYHDSQVQSELPE